MQINATVPFWVSSCSVPQTTSSKVCTRARRDSRSAAVAENGKEDGLSAVIDVRDRWKEMVELWEKIIPDRFAALRNNLEYANIATPYGRQRIPGRRLSLLRFLLIGIDLPPEANTDQRPPAKRVVCCIAVPVGAVAPFPRRKAAIAPDAHTVN